VVERHLAGAQDDVHGVLLVHRHLDLLAAAQPVVRRVGVPVRQDRPPVRARDHPHASVVAGAVRQGDPRGRDPSGVQPPVRAVLVPGDVARIPRVLGEDRDGPHEDVGPQQAFDGVEDGRVGREIVRPAKVGVRVPERLRHGPPPEPGGQFLEHGPEARRLVGGQNRHREEDPVLLVPLGLRGGQAWAHGFRRRTGR
jgi:hypothetical protein